MILIEIFIFKLIMVSVYDELYATELFETMSLQKDEDEHSLEMHLPYVAKLMQK